jgi:hypothetical protein
MTPIYPELDTIRTIDRIMFRTKLIKEYQGKYYYWHFSREYGATDIDIINLIYALNLFHKEVYKVIILGKVDMNLKRADGEPWFELAKDQIPEEQRLKDQLSIF